MNIQDRDGRTALMMASREGHDKCIEILVKTGADVNVQDSAGKDSTEICILARSR